MSTSGINSGGHNNYLSDRHLNKKADRHKKKHVDHHADKDSGHRCICGYARCNEVRDGFKGTGHVYDRRPISLQKPKQCDEWDDFFNSLKRNLHVRGEMAERLCKGGIGFRFDVAAHHFTEEVITQYWNNTSMRKIWGLRFNRADARVILHLPLDHRDRGKNGKYYINANNPIMDAAELTMLLNSDRGNRASFHSSHDPELESSRASLYDKKKDEKIQQLGKMLVGLRKEMKKIKQTPKQLFDLCISLKGCLDVIDIILIHPF